MMYSVAKGATAKEPDMNECLMTDGDHEMALPGEDLCAACHRQMVLDRYEEFLAAKAIDHMALPTCCHSGEGFRCEATVMPGRGLCAAHVVGVPVTTAENYATHGDGS